MIKIKLPDGKVKEYDENSVTGKDIALSIGENLARASVGIVVNGEVRDLSFAIQEDASIQILTFNDEEGKRIFWHSTAHVLAEAVTKLYPDAKITIGPAIENGFYYDFDMPPISETDLVKIEDMMKNIVKENQAFKKSSVSNKENAYKEINKAQPNNKYKEELINEFTKDEKITFYEHGSFKDLCKGPHLTSTGKIKAIKLTKVAAAYWRGDNANKQLQRIYGISFPDKKQLRNYLQLLEEAKKRDHRKIGKSMDIFEVSEDIGSGLILWLPNGNIIKEELENWSKETEKKWGYKRVTTPLISKEGLFYTSEHLPHYKDSMFSPMKIDGENYYIKPMNCPFHHKIFSARPRSYRDLPLRIAEYGTCHRYEQSGAITGLLRVRGMEMNDAHIYCTKEQAVQEFVDVIKLHEYYYNILGIKDYWMELALRNPENDKYHGEEKMWVEAEQLMKESMKKSNVKYEIERDGAAFYGPKMDFQIKSVIGKTFTASTNQIDLFTPDKFGLKYQGNDNKEHTPVVIHRAPLGTHERFIGFLLEHFAGKLPLWLSPEQIRIFPVSDNFNSYSREILELMQKNGLRSWIDDRKETMNKKIREAQLRNVPIMITVGEKEKNNKTLAIRTLNGKIVFDVKMTKFLEIVKENIEKKELTISF